jgi:hypothetical protein
LARAFPALSRGKFLCPSTAPVSRYFPQEKVAA